jgi:hypothetical protein
MLLRIDNVFINTPDVNRLAEHYSALTGMPIRRRQQEGPGVMWAEILVGGMEFSFRKANATQQIHEHLRSDFLETPPGGGVTVSFEVAKMEEVRDRLKSRGVKFRGDIIRCSNGQELISIFEDNRGRAVQLYEPRFASKSDAVIVASRNVTSAMSTNTVQVGSNLRQISNLAFSVLFYDDDLPSTQRFYGEVLELPVKSRAEDRVLFELDGTVLEFRKGPRTFQGLSAKNLLPGNGGIAVFEVRKLADAPKVFKAVGTLHTEQFQLSGAETGPRLAGADIEGNVFEFWERPSAF